MKINVRTRLSILLSGMGIQFDNFPSLPSCIIQGMAIFWWSFNFAIGEGSQWALPPTINEYLMRTGLPRGTGLFLPETID
jgi:hypothetical protein